MPDLWGIIFSPGTIGTMYLFSDQWKKAVELYQAFMQEGMGLLHSENLSGGGLVRSYGGWDLVALLRKEHEARIGDERILGDSDFVESVLINDVLKINTATDLQQKGLDLEQRVSCIGDYFSVHIADITQRGRLNKLSIAKGLICCYGKRELNLPRTEIAWYLGVSQPAISKAYS